MGSELDQGSACQGQASQRWNLMILAGPFFYHGPQFPCLQNGVIATRPLSPLRSEAMMAMNGLGQD